MEYSEFRRLVLETCEDMVERNRPNRDTLSVDQVMSQILIQMNQKALLMGLPVTRLGEKNENKIVKR